MNATPTWRRSKLLTIGWQDAGLMLDALASAVRGAGFAPTVIAGIARGGLPPAVALSNLLGVTGFRILGIPRNSGNGRYSERGEARLDYVVPEGSLAGERVLIVDDIMGDGGTMALAERTVRGLGAAEVRSAVVVRNVGSRSLPDFFAVEVDDWTVFPWEEQPDEGRTTGALRAGVPRGAGR
ncbi:phosphoribosyltransferase [Streptomyces sp. NPDC087212]|uniref:phosphoribosyltransferase n=1 Tax=Streptomyces sp. NPDC087212 TaxID=3365766 RepID=UPI00382B32D7